MKKTFKEASIDCMIDEVCRAYGLEARVRSLTITS